MKRLLIILSIAITSCYYGYAQQEMTTYEQQRMELAEEFLKKMLNTMGGADKYVFVTAMKELLKKADGDKFKEANIIEYHLCEMCEIGEFFNTDARILASSYRTDNIYTGLALQEWKSIGEWYRNERKKLELTKTAEDIKREKERLEMTGNPVGWSGIKKKIKSDFNKWATRGEFEKTANHKERLKTKSISVFDSICFRTINNSINKNINKTVSKYDADREGVIMRFYYDEEKSKQTSSPEGFFSVSPEDYQHFKGQFNGKKTYAKGVFLQNGDVYPATYHLVFEWQRGEEPDRSFDVVLGEPESLPLYMSEVLGDNENIDSLSNHFFDYSYYSINKIISRDELYDNYIHDIVKDTKLLFYYPFDSYWVDESSAKDQILQAKIIAYVDPVYNRLLEYRDLINEHNGGGYKYRSQYNEFYSDSLTQSFYTTWLPELKTAYMNDVERLKERALGFYNYELLLLLSKITIVSEESLMTYVGAQKSSKTYKEQQTLLYYLPTLLEDPLINDPLMGRYFWDVLYLWYSKLPFFHTKYEKYSKEEVWSVIVKEHEKADRKALLHMLF